MAVLKKEDLKLIYNCANNVPKANSSRKLAPNLKVKRITKPISQPPVADNHTVQQQMAQKSPVNNASNASSANVAEVPDNNNTWSIATGKKHPSPTK